MRHVLFAATRRQKTLQTQPRTLEHNPQIEHSSSFSSWRFSPITHVHIHPTTYCSLSQSMHAMYLVEVHRFEVTRVTVARAASSQVCSINVAFEDIARERKKRLSKMCCFVGQGGQYSAQSTTLPCGDHRGSLGQNI